MMIETADFQHWVLDNDLESNGFDINQGLAIESFNSQIFNLSLSKKNENLNENTFVSIPEKGEIKYPFLFKERKLLNYYKKTQHWIGVVTKIDSEKFYVNLYDKSNDDTYEIAEFDFDEVSKSDMNLVKLGSIFYYSLGFASNNGQIKKESFLRFKRSYPFSDNDFETIENRAEKFDQSINWD
ncbi:MAG TPA: hypothetical protein PLY70_08765 [Saprospiraceae bacterium]|nr:hypothetical protein [Saprospiraceae bacterium]HPN71454.1 hypothetical protein [Saprospiraceae bacterium]